MKLLARKALALLCLLLPAFTRGNHTQRAFLKEKLIITPIEQSNNKYYRTIKIISALGLSIFIDWSIFKCGKKFLIYCLQAFRSHPRHNHPYIQAKVEARIVFVRDRIPEVTINLFIPGFYFCTVYYLIHKIILNKLNKTHFLKFVKEWKLNEQYTPYEFRNAFEQLYKQHEKAQKPDQKMVNHLKQRISKSLLLKKG